MNIVVNVEIYGEEYIFHVGVIDDAKEIAEKYKDHPGVVVSYEWGPSTQRVEDVFKECDEHIKEYEDDHA